ncbi:MAG: PEGA domain-containing protein [Myxococcota bacterium]
MHLLNPYRHKRLGRIWLDRASDLLQTKYTKPLGSFAKFILPLLAGPLLLLSLVSAAFAEQATGAPGLAENETTAWINEGASVDAKLLDELHAGLREALTAEKGLHLITREALLERIGQSTPPVPSCLRGAQPCGSPEAMAYDALHLAIVVRVKVRRADGRLEAAYTVVDRRGQASNTALAKGRTPKDLAFAIVRTMYDATGILDVRTQPAGAAVLVDGSNVGTTPLTHRLPIGRHLVTVRLDDFQVIEKTIEVGPNTTILLEEALAQRPGILILEGAPAGALVFIGDAEQGKDATQPVELPPGDYTYEVRAPGFATTRGDVSVEAGLSTQRSVAMERANSLLRDIARDDIIHKNYLLRVSLDLGRQNTSFRGARNDDGDVELEFRRFTDATNPDGFDNNQVFTPGGLRIEAGYTWERFGITLLSLGLLGDTNNDGLTAQVDNLESGQPIDVTVTRLRQIQLRPAQLRYRFFYRNLAPWAEVGVGINFQRIEVVPILADPDDEAPIPATQLFQAEPFWTLSLGADYFFTPTWFGNVQLLVHDHLNRDVGTEVILSFGFGGAFENLFGVEPQPPEELR